MTQPQPLPGGFQLPNPDQINEFHRYDDLDTDPAAHHHTLGPDVVQASPGNHLHDGGTSAVLTGYSLTSHTHSFSQISTGAASYNGTGIGYQIINTLTDASSTRYMLFNLTNNVDQDINFFITGVGSSNKRSVIGPSTATRLNLQVGGVEKWGFNNAGTFESYSISLGTAAGNVSASAAEFGVNQGNAIRLAVRGFRHTAGTDHTTTALDLYRITDVTDQGGLRFNDQNVALRNADWNASDRAMFLRARGDTNHGIGHSSAAGVGGDGAVIWGYSGVWLADHNGSGAARATVARFSRGLGSLIESPLTVTGYVSSNLGYYIGDDARIHDTNVANAFRVVGQQDQSTGTIYFGNNQARITGDFQSTLFMGGTNSILGASFNYLDNNTFVRGPFQIQSGSFDMNSQPLYFRGTGSRDRIHYNSAAGDGLQYRGFNYHGFVNEAFGAGNAMRLDGAANLFVGGGGFFNQSTIREKKNVESFPVTMGLATVKKIRAVQYDRLDGKAARGLRQTGVIAEELLEIAPELVMLDKDGLPEAVNYAGLVPYLIKAVQDLSDRMDQLSARP